MLPATVPVTVAFSAIESAAVPSTFNCVPAPTTRSGPAPPWSVSVAAVAPGSSVTFVAFTTTSCPIDWVGTPVARVVAPLSNRSTSSADTPHRVGVQLVAVPHAALPLAFQRYVFARNVAVTDLSPSIVTATGFVCPLAAPLQASKW